MRKPTQVEYGGILYAAIAMCLFLQTWFGSEEAYKYVNPYVLFWMKCFWGALGTGASAIKMYMSGRTPTEPLQ